MISKEIIISNNDGLHMRPAGVFAEAMGKYKCDVIIEYNGSDFDGKSIMSIMTACIKCGSTIIIRCTGEDEKEALRKAVSIIKKI